MFVVKDIFSVRHMIRLALRKAWRLNVDQSGFPLFYIYPDGNLLRSFLAAQIMCCVLITKRSVI
jgi:hypothetical protein